MARSPIYIASLVCIYFLPGATIFCFYGTHFLPVPCHFDRAGTWAQTILATLTLLTSRELWLEENPINASTAIRGIHTSNPSSQTHPVKIRRCVILPGFQLANQCWFCSGFLGKCRFSNRSFLPLASQRASSHRASSSTYPQRTNQPSHNTG